MKPKKSRLQNWISCFAYILVLNTFHSQVIDNQIIETYSTPGSFTWTCPANVTQITVECWGGGGNGISGGGGGGGGGAFANKIVNVNSGTIYYFLVGGGGVSSWFNSVNSVPTSNNMVLADFGKDGYSNTGGKASSSYGDIKFNGGDGANTGNGNFPGGGGSSASYSGNGVSGNCTSGGIAGTGGGNGGNGNSYTFEGGYPGQFPGGGGGGGVSFGGGGANGFVRIIYYLNCSGYPNTGQITSNAISGCGLASFTATNLSNSTGVLYQWQISNDNNIWADINGATSTSYSTQLISSSYIRIKSNCQFSGLSSFSPSVFYQVFLTPSNPEIENVGLSNICQNDSTLLISNINSGMTFQWLKNNIIINGETNNSIYVKESGNYQLTIYNEYGCSSSSNIVNVIVNPRPMITSATALTICSSQPVNLGLTSNLSSLYTWVATASATINGESTTNQSSSTINDILTNTSSTNQTVTYTATPTSTSGNCTGTPQTITIIVVPPVILTNVTSKTICSGSAVGITLTSNVASSYSWTVVDNPNVTGESTTTQTTSSINNTLSTSSTTVQNVTYTVTPTSTTGSCAGSPQPIVVSVVPTIVMTNANTAIICSETAVNLSLTSIIPGTYSFVATDNTNTTGESTTAQIGTSITDPIINNTNTNQNVSYVVTPTSTTGSCIGTNQTITVTVIPSVIMTNANSKTICSGSSVNLALTSNVTSNYLWVATTDNANVSGESLTSQTGTTINNVLTNNSTIIQQVVYAVTPNSSFGSCEGTPQTVTITVIPTVTMTNSNSKTICSGSNVNISLDSNVPSSYSWSATNNLSTSGESTTTQSSSTITNVITNNSTGSQMVNYTISPTSTSGNCTGIPTVIAVTVLPVVTMSSSNAATICSGTSVNLSFTSNLPSTYSWIATDNPSITGESTSAQTGSTLTNTLNSSATTNQSVIYTVTPTSINGLCVGTSQNINVTVNSLPNSTFNTSGPTTFCQGGSVVLSASTGTGLTYQWLNNGVNISGATSSSYTASTTGVYSVLVSNSFGCSSTSLSTNVTVVSYPSATIDSQGISSFCQGGTVLLTANTGTGSTYQWSNNGTNISGATSLTYSATTAGTYTVIVTNAGLCSTTSNSLVLTLSQLTTSILPNTSSMNTGYVKSTGVKTSGNMSVSTSTTYGRGWAKFPLTSIPSGSVITAVTIKFYTYGGTSSTTSNTIRGFTGDPETMTGSTLYSTIGSGTIYNTSTWTIGTTTTPSLNTKVLAAAGITYVQNQLAIGYVNFGFVGGTTSLQSIYGSNNITYSVRLEISYNPPAPTATINATGNTTFCQGNTVTLNANTGSGLSYHWKNNGTNISGANSSTYTASSSGNYTVQVTNGSGCSTISNGTAVTVNPLPTATLTNTGPISFCQGGSVLLNVTSNGSTFQWKKDGVNISGATSSSYSANISGSYTVFVTNSFGCTNTSNSINVTVNTLPNPIISGITSICQGDSSVLSINSNTGITYQWRNNGVNINGATNYYYSVTSSGSNSVFVTNVNGCSATSPTVSVTVNQLPTSTISASNTTSFCQGGSTNLIADNNVGLSYQWYKNGVPINGANSLNYSATTSGNYNVYFTNSIGCSNYSSNSISVNVLPLPNLSVSGDSIICQGETTNLTATSNGNVTWNGNLNQNTIEVAPNISTLYSVSSIDSNGCFVQDQVLVTVNYPSDTTIYTSSFGPFVLNGQVYQASGVYTQNLQTVAGCDSIITINLNYITNSIEELSDIGITIYPNPSLDGVFILKIDNSLEQSNLGIFNSIGQFLFEQGDSNLVDLSSYTDGVYWIRLIVNEQLFYVRIVKG